MSSKYEKLIDLIVSEDQEKARALFHEIVVEQSRKIYEDLVNQEEELDEADDDNSFVNDISNDEEHIAGDEEGISVNDGEDTVDSEDTLDADGDVDGDEEGLQDRVMDLESAIDELKAEFDQLMAGEDTGDDSDGFGDTDELSDEDLGDSTDLDGTDLDDDGDDGKFEESLVREYVEKVTAPNNKSEGSEVGSAGKSVSVNKRSNVAGKNDMGGTSSNIARGGSNEVPSGPKKPSNAYTKGEGSLIGKVENSPGANTKGYSDRARAKSE